jgi:hypothetical protein
MKQLINPDTDKKAAPAITSFEVGGVNPNDTPEIYMLQSSVAKLVSVVDMLTDDMKSGTSKVHTLNCAKAIDKTILTISKLTMAIDQIKARERKANVKDVTPWSDL